MTTHLEELLAAARAVVANAVTEDEDWTFCGECQREAWDDIAPHADGCTIARLARAVEAMEEEKAP